MSRVVVRELLPRKAAEAEAQILGEVFREAWTERRRNPPGSPERACTDTVLRDVIERLRRLPRASSR